MKRRLYHLCLSIMFLTVMGCSSVQQAGTPPAAAEHRQLIEQARTVLAEMAAEKRFSLLDSLLPQCRAVLVYPELTRVAVGYGGTKGKGVLFLHERENSWKPVALYTFEAASGGVQLGVSKQSLLLVMTHDAALQYVLHHSLLLHADLFFTAGPGSFRMGSFRPGEAEGIYYFSKVSGPFLGVYVENGNIRFFNWLQKAVPAKTADNTTQ